MSKMTYVIDPESGVAPSADLQLEWCQRAYQSLPSAKTGESIPLMMGVAANIALDDYTIDRLVEWMGGIDAVAEFARSRRDWVMRDFATSRGAKLSWSLSDLPPSAAPDALPANLDR